MERILVSMDAPHWAWEAFSRAISLAKRIGATVYVLVVAPPRAKGPGGSAMDEADSPERDRLELMIEAAKSDGVAVELFVSEGAYAEEVIEFVDSNRISLVVAEAESGEGRLAERDVAPLRKILHRIHCPLELVSQKGNNKRAKVKP